MKKIIAIALIPIAFWLIWSAMTKALTKKASADIVTLTEDEDGEKINIVSWQGNINWSNLSTGYTGTWVLGKQTLYIDGEIAQKAIIVIKNGTPNYDDEKFFSLDFTNSSNSNGYDSTGTYLLGGSVNLTIRENWESIKKISMTRTDNHNISLNFYNENGIIGQGTMSKPTTGNGIWTSVSNFSNNLEEIDLSYLETIKINEYERGYTTASNERLENLTPWGQIKMGVDELFNIPILGENVTIGTIIRIGLGAVMVGIIVKLFLGG